ncbi:MAG: oligosaccharide flippase family protein [Ignavibacteriales bacterium]|nr:oligosaccharide flippase family protein [Ignavibacteriales bacterium]
MKRLPFLNAISGVAQIVVNTGLLLVIIPTFVRTLGLQVYSTYALITAIGGLGVFTNFGFNTSLIKYLAELKDKEESGYDIVVTSIIIGVSTSFVVVLLLVFSDFILSGLLNLGPETLSASVRWFFFACVGTNAFQVIGQVPGAVLDAQQRVYITNGVQLGVGALGKISILISLLVDPSLATVGWIMLGFSFVGMFLLGWFAFRTWGRISCPLLWTRFAGVARKHFAYGRNIYATAVIGFFYEPLTKVLISHFVGLTEVGFFDIALRIKGFVWSVVERLLYPLLPMFAGKTSFESVRTLMEEVQHKLSVAIVSVIVATIFLSEPLVSVWLGRTLWPVVLSVICVVTCYMIALLFVPTYHFLTVKGYPHKTLLLQAVNVGMNVVLFGSLVPWFGYFGALSAFCLAVLTSTVMSAWYQWSILHSKPVASRDSALRLVKLAGSLLLANYATTLILEGYWIRICALIAVNGVATILLSRWLKMITREDVKRYVGLDSRFGLVLKKLLVQRA